MSPASTYVFEVKTGWRVEVLSSRGPSKFLAVVTGGRGKTFTFRSLRPISGSHRVGRRDMCRHGDSWLVPRDPRVARGYYGFDAGRVLLVGQAPNRWMHLNKKNNHTLMRRDLAELCGVGFPDPYLRLFARTNVLQVWPGKAPSGAGDAFPIPEAREEAADLLAQLRGLGSAFDRIVLLGRGVSRACGLEGAWFEWLPCVWGPRDEERLEGVEFAVAPHPSRVSHFWNTPRNVEQAGAFWRELAQVAGRNVSKKWPKLAELVEARDREPQVMGRTRAEAERDFRAVLAKPRGEST